VYNYPEFIEESLKFQINIYDCEFFFFENHYIYELEVKIWWRVNKKPYKNQDKNFYYTNY
jgi:hypothetical protein